MSTEFIVLGGEKPKTKVDQGEGIGRIEVSGSTMHARDPMEAEARAELALLNAHRRSNAPLIPPDMKWCSAGDHVVSKNGFSPDRSRPDGLHVHCKACRAAHQREIYRKQVEAEGRSVRQYRRTS